ncbi:MAG TPA: DUF4375 domain-containing protein [Gemmatimonadaceae bacterium]
MDSRFRHLTPELLASLSADEVADAIVQHVLHRLAGAWGREAPILRALPAGVRAIYTTWLVDAEVNAGGFQQFFFNSSGQYAGDALAGYELLGAEEYAAIMRSAIATFEIDHQRLAEAEADDPTTFADSPVHGALREIDQRYYALGDRIYQKWAVFVVDRPDAF